MRRLGATLALAGALLAPGLARAADPIMPLSQVRSGMRCTGYSVIRGTEISSFDVEVLDVVAQQSPAGEPLILVRVSGPAVAGSGIAEGFSGSPVYCRDGAGVERNIGALSYGIGQYGDTVGLATPIEEMLGDPVTTPASARRRPDLLRAARPLAEPRLIAGVSPALGGLVTAAARRAGRSVRIAPAGPLGGLAPQKLRPGAAVAAGWAVGDISDFAYGTVSYTDGARVWAFGHPLEAAGPRALFLQDVYIYGVIDNPVAGGYKLGSAVNVRGTLTNDDLDAVIGRVGSGPPSTTLRINARNLATRRSEVLTSRLADESAVRNPAGTELSFLLPLALVEADARILRTAAPEQTARFCMRVTLKAVTTPLRFCNRYVGDEVSSVFEPPAPVAPAPLLDDASSATALLESYRRPLRIRRVEIELGAKPGLDLATIEGASAPRRMSAGGSYRARLRVRTAGGSRLTVPIRVRVPRRAKRGVYRLRFIGKGPDTAGEDPTDALANAFGFGPADEKIGSLDELEADFADLRRFDGVSVRLRRARSRSRRGRLVKRFTDPSRRIAGKASVRVRVVR